MSYYNFEQHSHRESLSEHLQLFNLVIETGVEQAHEISKRTGHNLLQLKAQCRSAGEELIAVRGHLLPQEQSVFNWSKL